MRLKLTGWIVLLLLSVIVIGVLWYFLSAKPTLQATQQPSITLPSSGSVVSVSSSTSAQTAQRISVPTQDGNTLVTNDFIHNSITLEDPSNTGNYYLTGASSNGYAIGYRTPAQFFTIALQKEPIGETRIAAENFLLSTLGITQDQLCNLKYYVGTDVYTNSFYAGKNLGFSFCPGATVLPK